MARPRLLAVVVADHRHRGGIIESFAQALSRHKAEQLLEGARNRRQDRNRAPGIKPAQDGRLAANAVHDASGEGRGKTIHPGLHGQVAC